MRSILTISLLWITSIGVAQTKLLKTKSFSELKLDDQWIYVKLDGSSSNSALKALSQEKKSLGKSGSGSIKNLIKVKVPEGKDPITFCNELRRNEGLIYADPIIEYQLLSTTSDPLASNQYYLDKISAYDAWDITTGDDDITIGIIDSGLDTDHEDLINNLWLNTDDPIDGIDNDENGFIDDYTGYDFADSDTDPNIQNGNHGMIVGGIAGATANNGKGIAGVGYNTKVAALKGFRSSNGTSNGLYDAIIYAADNGFEVVNLSWGRMGQPLQSEQDIINYAVLEKDMIVVAAAGNEGGKPTEENKWYPASYDHVLSVGASDENDNKSSGSSFNYSVDLVAPGVSMYSTVKNDGYADGGPGTSFASPQVAAAAALVKDQFPSLNAIQIMERVRATSDDIYDIGSNSIYEGKLGKGRLNVHRAVSETNVKSLRAENPSLSTRFGETVFFGDTVQVTATLSNYLSAINNPQITISSPNSDFTISQGFFSPGYMGTMDSSEISFEVILDENIAPETTIGIRLDYSGVGYNDFQYLDVITSPDYADFGNEKLSMTISGNGNTGLDTYGVDPKGSGFQYLLDTIMNYMGMMIATNSIEVSDNIISNYSSEARAQDFGVQKNYKLYHHPGADHFGYSEFTDINRPLIIEQSNIAWENENFMILRYRIINNSTSAINNLSVGFFADWDLDEKTENYAEYDETDHYAYVRNLSNDLFGGIQVLGGDIMEYSVLDMGAFNGNSNDVDNVFSNATKYDFLVNQNVLTAGDQGAGNDVATINGVTINTLNAYEETFVNVIYAVATSQANLETEFTDAIGQLNDFILKPRVLETVFTCDGFAVEIDPEEGVQYEFYEDPLAQDLISTAESINVTTSNDTTFYVKNVDENYPSDIFEIRLKLLDEIADFKMSTDTLYLDHPTTNVVQFEDQSLDAVSWSWDFDEGTSSSIQNPSLSFSETGTYNISLSIENTQGCVDVISKDLVVANRPSSPNLADLIICPGENVTLNDPIADKLKVYTFQDQIVPTTSGTTTSINNVLIDTTIYVSGVYGSFESEKIPLRIDVLEVSGNIGSYPDTTSSVHNIQLVAENISPGSSLQWYLEGEPTGSNESVIIEALEGSSTVSLDIISEDACTKNLTKTINISTSPFASQDDLVSCAKELVTIRPGNGTTFGFYEDPELTRLIKKGTSLTTNEYTKVYVVGLDDGLPGLPVEVNIINEEIEVDISYIEKQIGEKYQVDLSVNTNDDVINYEWYVNGDLTETIVNPTLFFHDEGYEIVLKVLSVSGCAASDTLNLDFSPPLAIDNDKHMFVYPNPNQGYLTFEHTNAILEVQILSLDGKLLFEKKRALSNLDISFLPKGIYLVKMITQNETFHQQLVVE